MKTLLLAANCLALLAPAFGYAQSNPRQPIVRADPRESHSPARPSGGPSRPAPANPGQFHPPAAAPSVGVPYRPGSPGPYRRGPVNPGSPNPPSGGVLGGPAEPRYGLTRSAPGAQSGGYHRVLPGHREIWAGNQNHWGWNGHRIHARGYVFPAGHHYRRCHIGQRLPLIFLSEIYYFTDYAAAGFDDPPDGYEWVRYGPDLLLVDLDTGEVVDVEYGVFD